jgi:hypothetical protein
MKALKWVGIGVGGFAAVAGAIFAVVFTLTGDAAATASDFLKLVSESKYEQAHQSTTPQFRKEIKVEKLRELIKLEAFESIAWTKREISNAGIKLEGTIRTRSGATVYAIVELEKIDGAYKVYSVRLRRGDAS